jgi:hypothetical protein
VQDRVPLLDPHVVAATQDLAISCHQSSTDLCSTPSVSRCFSLSLFFSIMTALPIGMRDKVGRVDSLV